MALVTFLMSDRFCTVDDLLPFGTPRDEKAWKSLVSAFVADVKTFLLVLKLVMEIVSVNFFQARD